MTVKDRVYSVQITGTNSITLTASEQADIEDEAYQKIKEDNKCEGVTSCTNTGDNALTITASDFTAL